ncbi:MAG: MBL fold metallo-hydrolase [Burkholderiaceae bacterium]|nr:MBL fold metallo-hydrolase [Burkholderiaceae bacterium]
MKITFLGAADTVTGSKHLVHIEGKHILLDCGLFQGYKILRERNWTHLPFPAEKIDTVLLSHAHLDHSGWLPVLCKQGFKGPIYASKASRDLTEILLLDSAHLQEEDARRANRGGWSRHHPALPLYNVADAKRAIKQIVVMQTGREFQIGNAKIDLIPTGHLLGATALRLRTAEGTLVFSGDLGRSDDLLMPPPQSIDKADILLIESTYGNRLHSGENVQSKLGEIIRETIRCGGSVLLPSFAVGRAQALLLVLQRLKAAGEIPENLSIFLDSPMAATATTLYQQHRKLLRISAGETTRLTQGITLIETPQDSEKLTRQRWPKVIISASGMATGGRVLFHLKALAPNPRNHIVFPGFQVGGTRGAALIEGAREVKIHGQYVAVKAQVSHLEGFSGHADANGLMSWLREFKTPPKHTFVVHGEAAAADTLRLRIKDELGWSVSVPEQGSTEQI